MTVQFVPRRTAGELANTLKQVISLYRCAGFISQTALMDGEFEMVKEKLVNIILIYTTARNVHVPEKERKIHHIKERSRCTRVDLPYKIMHCLTVKEWF
eukprot:CCRYP_020965-RA/>CCRYP_020965-RA protein AED:0.11 eAED:-0.12 QI:0/-1/0/1/-1/0/1/0/98